MIIYKILIFPEIIPVGKLLFGFALFIFLPFKRTNVSACVHVNALEGVVVKSPTAASSLRTPASPLLSSSKPTLLAAWGDCGEGQRLEAGGKYSVTQWSIFTVSAFFLPNILHCPRDDIRTK
jgi:hypothetical protein